MIASTHNIYEFKVTLEEVQPLVWRQIQVPENYSFWDLHVAIQDSMGWKDYHLHEWIVADNGKELHLGIYPAEFEDQPEVVMDWEVPIKQFFQKLGDAIPYEYDFGDGWQHLVELQNILPAEFGKQYPRCIAGEHACPPEDVGGVPGYDEFLKAINNVNHENNEHMLKWIGGSFDPHKFSPEEVRFDNPRKRWKIAFKG